jgi:hypothetical protein
MQDLLRIEVRALSPYGALCRAKRRGTLVKQRELAQATLDECQAAPALGVPGRALYHSSARPMCPCGCAITERLSFHCARSFVSGRIFCMPVRTKAVS